MLYYALIELTSQPELRAHLLATIPTIEIFRIGSNSPQAENTSDSQSVLSTASGGSDLSFCTSASTFPMQGSSGFQLPGGNLANAQPSMFARRSSVGPAAAMPLSPIADDGESPESKQSSAVKQAGGQRSDISTLKKQLF